MYPDFILQSLDLLPDGTFLKSQLGKIRERYFPACPLHTVTWGIPPATPVKRVTPASAQDTTMRERLGECRSLIALGRWQAAANALQPLADADNAEAERLLSHVLRRLGGDWETYARRYADRVYSIQMTPASSHDRQQKSITLHPCLAHRQAPQFVLNYLIYHECAAFLCPPEIDGTASAVFLKYEADAPSRTKAHKWLSRQGFPVFQIS